MTDYIPCRTEFKELLLSGDETIVSKTEDTLQKGINALDFLEQVYQPVMAEIGDMFSRMEIFLPELIQAADRAREVSEAVIRPAILKDWGEVRQFAGKIVIGTARGDMHDIGKNMVAFMLEVNGFKVIDLGNDVPPRAFIESARENEADLIGISALMTTSMPYMKETIELRNGLGFEKQVGIIVGGAPITAEYSERIGADDFGRDAREAVSKSLKLVEAYKKA